MTGLATITLNLKDSTKDLFLFSLPIIFGQLGIMLIGVGDIYIASMHETLSVAALGVAIAFINPIFLFGIGMMMGIAPMLSIKRGRGEDALKYYLGSLVYALLIGIVMSLSIVVLNEFIPFLGVKKELVPLIQRYIQITTWSFPFAFMFQAIKEFLQSFEKVFLPNLVAIIAVIVNLALNYLFVFGHFGFPKLGYDGLAYASFCIRIFLFVFLIFATKSYLKKQKVDWTFIKELFRFSFPIASMFFFEVLGFCFVSVVVGTIGISVAAANNIIMNIASVTFMIPLSISSAVTVKVGMQFGKGNYLGIRNFSFAALLLATSFMCITCCLYIFFPSEFLKYVTSDPDVIRIGVPILFIVGLFQIVDGLQITLSGILRGLEKTKEAFYVILVGYWVIGLPFGLLLCYTYTMGARGLWVGLAVSLAFVSVLLSVILHKKLKVLKTQVN